MGNNLKKLHLKDKYAKTETDFNTVKEFKYVDTKFGKSHFQSYFSDVNNS